MFWFLITIFNITSDIYSSKLARLLNLNLSKFKVLINYLSKIAVISDLLPEINYKCNFCQFTKGNGDQFNQQI